MHTIPINTLWRTRPSLVCAVALALAAVAPTSLAQQSSTAEIEQTAGDSNTATIIQLGAPTADAHITQEGQLNEGVIEQSGPASDVISASVLQSGTMQLAFIEQENVADRAAGSITQVGATNVAEVLQSGVMDASFDVHQDGEANHTTIYQSRQRASAEVTQTGLGNSALVEQVGSYFHDHAEIYQKGSHNSIEVLQEDENGGTVVAEQVGSLNETYVHQALSGPPNSVSAFLFTVGTGNKLVVDQRRSNAGRFELRQTGDFNEINLVQVGDGAAAEVDSHASNGNRDVLNQSGSGVQIFVARFGTDDSSVAIDQDSFVATLSIEQTDSHLAHAEVNQWNDVGGQISVHQLGIYDSSVFVTQRIDNGTATISQMETSLSEVSVYQSGIGSLALVEQSISESALADIRQIGSAYDTASVNQNRVQSTEALVFQSAEGGGLGLVTQSEVADSSARIDQYTATRGGTGLIADIYQAAGTDMLAHIEQSGEYNEAGIHQVDSDYSEADITQHAVSAYAQVNQVNGSYNTASITQGYENFSATISQSGSYNHAAITQF